MKALLYLVFPSLLRGILYYTSTSTLSSFYATNNLLKREMNLVMLIRKMYELQIENLSLSEAYAEECNMRFCQLSVLSVFKPRNLIRSA